MVVTNDDALAARVRMFASHGMERDPALFQPWPVCNGDGTLEEKNVPTDPSGGKTPWLYQQQELGYNYRVTDIQCALGTSQFGRLDPIIQRRRILFDQYQQAFGSNPKLICPPCPEGTDPAYHLYVLRFKDGAESMRLAACTALREEGIFAQVHYLPVYLQPWYRQQYGYAPGKCPEAERVYGDCLSIPLFPAMTEEDMQKVIQIINGLAES